MTIFTLFHGCAPEVQKSYFKPRKKVKVTELYQHKGEPQLKFTNAIDARYEMHQYDNEEVYQSQGPDIVAKFTSPVQEENYIQYWKIKLQGLPYQILQNKQQGEDHHSQENILKCEIEGLEIFYDVQTGIVSRIVNSKDIL
jgi:hypothetical protein